MFLIGLRNLLLLHTKSRFLAEFTLSPFASLRAVRKGRANGLGMTRVKQSFSNGYDATPHH